MTGRVALAWEHDHAPTALRIRLRAYVAAMDRCESWQSDSLRRRRRELRELARATGELDQLGAILDVLRARMTPTA